MEVLGHSLQLQLSLHDLSFMQGCRFLEGLVGLLHLLRQLRCGLLVVLRQVLQQHAVHLPRPDKRR